MKEARQLTSYLQRLKKPAGLGGFEDLVARLLEKFTGQRFFLAHAGSQEGRDLSTGGFGATWVAVEAKRFLNETAFNLRALLGELSELPEEIDLWILASTRRVPEQVISALRTKAKDRGVDVETLDAPADRLGDLPVLCAAYEDIVVSFLGTGGADGALGPILAAIRQHPDFTPALESLRDRFRAGSIGYSQARSASLSYLHSAFGDSHQARVDLGQPINVLEDGGRHVVERRQTLDGLDSWWSRWSATHLPFVLLGEEGMGKTWALASWLARKLDPQDDLPLTLFLPSWAVDTPKALDLIAGALLNCTHVRDARFWSKRAKAFAERPVEMGPALLLILDGLNEQPQFDWRTLLESLRIPPWRDQVATVLTCRPAYWREELVSVGKVSSFEIGPYDDLELSSAVEKSGPQAANLPSSLEPLLRFPRYFELAIRHREVLEQSGDVTVDRLLYEDWKHRASRKRGLFSNMEFRSLLVQLAERHRDSLSKREVQNLLPLGDGLLTSLDEIITGGILVPDHLGRYTVEPRRLVQGLGLLLADEVRSQSQQGELAMREMMASFLEPHADMDRKVAVCRSAVTFAVFEPGFPESARFVLFEQWLGNRNLSRQDFESFIAYLPASIDSYLSLVEGFWSTRRTNHQAQSLIVNAFWHWRNNAKVQQDLARACERWLSSVHLYGYRFMRGQDPDSRAALRNKIEERAGRPLRAGDRFLLSDELEVIEDDELLWLAAPALLLASLLPVTLFVPALRRWALSRSVMGYADEAEAVAWMLRWSSEDLWPGLKAAVVPLLDGPRVAQQAAWRLLWASGREEAAPMLERMPRDLLPLLFQEESYATDPCRPFWRHEDCAMCAARPDLPDRLVTLKLAPHALDPCLRLGFDLRPRLQRALSGIRTDKLSSGSMTSLDDLDFRDIEPTLAAFAPDLLAETYRALTRALPNRPEKDHEALLVRLSTTTLLLQGPEEQRGLRAIWERICQTETWNDAASYAEMNLFAAILFHVQAKTQLELLLRRPQKAFDDLELGLSFKRLPTKDLKSLAQGLLASSQRDLRRKLWYLWYQPAAPVVEVLGVERLVSLLDYPNQEIRSIAENWLFRSGCDEAFDLAIERGIVTPALTRNRRRLWGRWFAVRMQSRLPYATLAQAIDLGSLSYVVRRRPGDLAPYVRDLDRAVRDSASTRDENLETGYCKKTLQAVVKLVPQSVNDWVRLASEQRGERSSPLIESCHMMLESLCEVLLETNQEQGVELFQTLLAQRQHARTVDHPTGVDMLALTLFRIPRSKHSQVLLREWLDTCSTDNTLFELALAAAAVHKDERLAELIQEGLSSSIPVKKAAALVLAGFSVHGSRSATLLESVQLHPEGWLHAVQDRARRCLDRDRWAQEWFRRFAISQSTEESFAAFRLFLRCVDRRYWIWKNDVIRSANSVRRRYWEVNRDSIEEAIEKNEKGREKHFLGEEIAEGKVQPWLKRYLG